MNDSNTPTPPQILTEEEFDNISEELTNKFVEHHDFLKELHGDEFLDQINFKQMSFMFRWFMRDYGCNEFKAALEMMKMVASQDNIENAEMEIKKIAAVSVEMVMSRINSGEEINHVELQHNLKNTIVAITQAKFGHQNRKVCLKCKTLKITNRQTLKSVYYKQVGCIAYQSTQAPVCEDLRTLEEVKMAEDVISIKE